MNKVAHTTEQITEDETENNSLTMIRSKIDLENIDQNELALNSIGLGLKLKCNQ